jgi:hypothetical protein
VRAAFGSTGIGIVLEHFDGDGRATVSDVWHRLIKLGGEVCSGTARRLDSGAGSRGQLGCARLVAMMIARDVTLEIERRFGTQLAYFWRLHELGRRAIDDGQTVATTGDVSHRLAISMLSRATSALHAVE